MGEELRWVKPPHDFKVPWKNGTKFIIDGMLFEVYEMKRAKPLPRALIKLIGVAVSVEASAPTIEGEIPVTEPVTPKQEFDNESYTPPGQ